MKSPAGGRAGNNYFKNSNKRIKPKAATIFDVFLYFSFIRIVSIKYPTTNPQTTDEYLSGIGCFIIKKNTIAYSTPRIIL
jgi:hypothetical protein